MRVPSTSGRFENGRSLAPLARRSASSSVPLFGALWRLHLAQSRGFGGQFCVHLDPGNNPATIRNTKIDWSVSFRLSTPKQTHPEKKGRKRGKKLRRFVINNIRSEKQPIKGKN